jgi:hypothetical protein
VQSGLFHLLSGNYFRDDQPAFHDNVILALADVQRLNFLKGKAICIWKAEWSRLMAVAGRLMPAANGTVFTAVQGWWYSSGWLMLCAMVITSLCCASGWCS